MFAQAMSNALHRLSAKDRLRFRSSTNCWKSNPPVLMSATSRGDQAARPQREPVRIRNSPIKEWRMKWQFQIKHLSDVSRSAYSVHAGALNAAPSPWTKIRSWWGTAFGCVTNVLNCAGPAYSCWRAALYSLTRSAVSVPSYARLARRSAENTKAKPWGNVLKNAVNAQLHALRSRKRAQFDALLHEMSAWSCSRPPRAKQHSRTILGNLREHCVGVASANFEWIMSLSVPETRDPFG